MFKSFSCCSKAWQIMANKPNKSQDERENVNKKKEKRKQAVL
jgi:hypothetical protein